jgi:hypothetical protein
VLANPCVAGDTVVTQGYTLASLVNALPLSGGTVTGATTFNSSVTINGGSASGYTGYKNRIINGEMDIDQRNNGASVTPGFGATYTVDRWLTAFAQSSKFSIQRNAGSVTPPVGFTNYLGATSLSAYSVVSTDFFTLQTNIEGLNVADLAWGTASAATVTLSFWVRSSLTGTFGGAINNSGGSRSYPFSYTISAANTWEQKSITIAGDTSGTWLTTNGIGITVNLSMGMGSTYIATAGTWATGPYYSSTGSTNVVGTNGATFYITGVQLERGINATSFEFRDYGRELMMCQRYFQIYSVTAANSQPICAGQCYTTTAAFGAFNAPVVFRSVPTLTLAGTTGCYNAAAGNAGGTVALDVASTASTIRLNCTGASGLVAGNATGIYVSGTGSTMSFSAEL